MAAQTLQDAGARVTVLEAEDKVGGRMRTDRVGGGAMLSGCGASSEPFITANGPKCVDVLQPKVYHWRGPAVGKGKGGEWEKACVR